jgi:uncharacterized protein YmfQ (DUF2313 family)
MPAADKILKYSSLVKRLFPLGKAWEDLLDSPLFSALGVEFARVDDRSKDLLTELDPLTATELIDEWETLLGLPDQCTPEGLTLQDRREQARQKLADQGGQSAPFLESVAEQLGFADTVVSDFRQFYVGRARVGDPLTNDFIDAFTVGESVGSVLLNVGWLFYFEVNSLASVNDPFEVGIDTVGEPLVEFGNPLLQCTIRKLKPAHAAPFFTFRDP